jgi:hypothetical protein
VHRTERRGSSPGQRSCGCPLLRPWVRRNGCYRRGPGSRPYRPPAHNTDHRGAVYDRCPGGAFSPAFVFLLAAQVVIGLGVGSASLVVPMYIGEAAPPRFRGALVSFSQAGPEHRHPDLLPSRLWAVRDRELAADVRAGLRACRGAAHHRPDLPGQWPAAVHRGRDRRRRRAVRLHRLVRHRAGPGLLAADQRDLPGARPRVRDERGRVRELGRELSSSPSRS